MSRFAFFTANRLLKRNGYTSDGNPRIYNLDKTTYTAGYVEVNTQATSPFSRTKVHKCWFEGTTDIVEGDLIQDKVDGKYYLVMSLKAEYIDGDIAYWDGTLYHTNVTCTISRFSTGTPDFFGITSSGAATVVASGVYIMANPQNFSVNEQPDTLVAADKIKIAVQSKYLVVEKDRLETSVGQNLVVESVDKFSLNNIDILMCNMDRR